MANRNAIEASRFEIRSENGSKKSKTNYGSNIRVGIPRTSSTAMKLQPDRVADLHILLNLELIHNEFR